MRTKIRTRRRGFTMLELLIVVVIAIVLATLAFRVMGGMLSAARDAGTKSTITKVGALLSERQSGFERYYETLKPRITSYITSTDMQNAGGNVARAKILVKKRLFAQFFPMTFAEMDANALPGPSNVTPLTVPGLNPALENSEVLYYMLSGEVIPGTSYSVETPGLTPVGADQFSTSEVMTDPNTGRKRFVDAWGKPLRFYRWPTRLLRSGGYTGSAFLPEDLANAAILNRTLPAATDLARDPDDVLGLTILPNWEYASATPPNDYESGYHTPGTFHTPLVVSAGSDGLLGLYEPSDTANYGNLARTLPRITPAEIHPYLLDDLSNLNVTAGGK